MEKIVDDDMFGSRTGTGGDAVAEDRILPQEDGYDVVVVGSGYGGAVASCRLAEAGLKVCVVEKGRRWQPWEFPDSFFQVMRNIQVNCPLGSWGKDTLPFQCTIDGDCLAFTGAGLGGGSLVNAGVMARTPQRTLRDPRWPEEWRHDWSTYESLAEAMTEPETVPHDFPKKKVMDIVSNVLEDLEPPSQSRTSQVDKVRLSIRFKDGTNVAGVKQSGCIGCGNCLNGCRYNAKNSMDKNYIAKAIQAGAEVQTKTKVIFIAASPVEPGFCSKGVCSTASWACEPSDDNKRAQCEENCLDPESEVAAVRRRRWRVYLDDVNYITADFVVLAAGVLGTTEILLRSRERGLRLSGRLGYGVSCNGNNVAYASGSVAPTRGVGMDSKDFANVPISERPGPAICNSFTSSAGYTVQGATIPKNFPYVFFRVLTLADTVSKAGWLHALLDILCQQLKVWMHTKDSQTLSLNMIGYDEGDGQVYLDKISRRVRFVAPHDKDMVKKISACRRLAARMRAELFTSNSRSTSVHLLGGCNAAVDAKRGVANPEGQVFDPCPRAPVLQAKSRRWDAEEIITRSRELSYSQKETTEGRELQDRNVHLGTKETDTEEWPTFHEGLYISDGSLIPCAIGVNPSFTITVVAERVASAIVREAVPYMRKKRGICQLHLSKSLISTNLTRFCSARTCVGSRRALTDVEQERVQKVQVEDFRSSSPTCHCNNQETDATVPPAPPPDPIAQVGMTEREAPVTVRETLRGQLGGIPCSLHVIMHMGVDNDQSPSCSTNEEELEYNRRRHFGDSHKLLRGRVGGSMMISKLDAEVLHIVDGSVDMCWVDARTPYTQYMHYHLHLASATGARYFLSGEKVMHPYLGGIWGWQESTTLHVKLHQITEPFSAAPSVSNWSEAVQEKASFLDLEGELRVSLFELMKSVVQLKGVQKLEFVKLLAGTLLRTYLWSSPRVLHPRNHLLAGQRSARRARSRMDLYPRHILHEFQTDDGVKISARQWENPSQGGARNGSSNVVLLLNGYSIEGYWLPTEPRDLVRTLLQNGYEPWILNGRLHPDHATERPFNLDDLARFDVPAVVRKIEDVRNEKLPIHVVAHCVGGLMMHMAIMDGHLPISKVASLLCTNSSMFFRVTGLAMAKLILPLMPISMAILGKKTVLSTSENQQDSFNHRLLRFIARRVPRPECCTSDSCSVFAGVFGNGFWHANVSPSVHAHQVCTAPTIFPMSGLPHLRQIILKGHLVDNSGLEVYMTHPERLALPTTYINGGREVLVTKETGKLAKDFMRMHHPEFVHSHVIVPEFGHSDLLIGEHSSTHVFPHILQHLKRVRDGEHVIQHGDQQEMMDWEKGHRGGRTIMNIWKMFSTFVILFVMVGLVGYFLHIFG